MVSYVPGHGYISVHPLLRLHRRAMKDKAWGRHGGDGTHKGTYIPGSTYIIVHFTCILVLLVVACA